jgi:flagellar hook-associated protein 1 FlgK
MSSLAGAINAALSGIEAFEEAIQTVSTNISNETTPGYALQTVETETSAVDPSGAGSGVIDPAIVQRAADGFAVARLNNATSANESAQTLSAALSAIDQALQGSGDINKAASAFFSDLSTLASDPTNSTQAATVLADAGNLVNAFHAAAKNLTSQSSGIAQSLQQDVASANQLLSQLATINKKLQTTPNDNSLLDEQQAALNSLSGLLGIQTVPLQNGAVEVTVNGTVLLDQSGAQNLSLAQATPTGAPEITAGTSKTPLNGGNASGSIGGNIQAFQNIENVLDSIDFFAGTLASSVNQVQAEGLTGSGSQGAPLFTIPPPQVVAGKANTGTAALTASITNAAALPSNGEGYILSFGPSGWTATVPGTTQSFSLGSGPTLSPPGLSITVNGSAASGDTFLVNPSPGVAASISLASTSQSALAIADPYVATAGKVSSSGAVTNSNTGSEKQASGTVTSKPANGATIIPAANFGQALTLTFTSPTAYTITNTAGVTVASGTWSKGTEIAFAYPSSSLAAGDFFEISLSGSAAKGDVISLAPGGANNGSNAQRLANLFQGSSESANGSLKSAILSIVGNAGSNASAAKMLAGNTQNNLTSAQQNLSAIAGVDTNSQAVVLTQYQQAFQAASQVISIANQMFQDLVSAIS